MENAPHPEYIQERLSVLEAVANHLYRTGHKPVTKLYSGYRHEIHNYKTIKNEVVAGITDFFDSQLG